MKLLGGQSPAKTILKRIFFCIFYSANTSYAEWSNWSNCTSLCNGTQNRTRTCDSSEPRDCPGSLGESRPCNIEACFSSWTPWTECSHRGYRNRTKYYLGDMSQKKSCNGSLSVIEKCQTCNMTCGIGFEIRKVNCTSSTQRCETQVHQCNQTNTPGNATFNSWSEWGECTSTCGGVFYQNRTRYATSNESSLMYNPEVESKECVCLRNESCNCQWSNWTSCNTTCGGGVHRRVFNCSFTSLGLVNCSGSMVETEICNNHSCPGKYPAVTMVFVCHNVCKETFLRAVAKAFPKT